MARIRFPHSTGPLPILAQFFSGPNRWFIQFDQNIALDAGIIPTQFRFFEANTQYQGSAVFLFSADTLRVNASSIGPAIHADTATYFATTGGITGAVSGIEAPAFTNFPVT